MIDMHFNVFMPLNDTIQKDSTTKIVEIDGRNIHTLTDFYTLLSKELLFGDQFGNNLDALYDSLADLSWLPVSRIILKFINTDEWLKEETQDRIFDILEVFNDAASTFNSDPVFGNSERELTFYFEQSNRIEQILDASYLIWGHVG